MYQDNRVTKESVSNARESSDLRVPSTWKSMGMEAAESATALPRAIFDIHNSLRGLPGKNPLDSSFEVFHKAMETPNEGWGQETADFFAAGIGYLNPMNDIALIRPALGAASKVSTGLSRLLPSSATALTRTPIRQFGGAIGKYLPKTIGGAGEHVAKSLAIGTALTAPQAMIDHYDAKKNKFDMWGAAEQSFSNGLLAVAIDAVPITAGLVFGKHKKTFAKEYDNPMPGDNHRMGGFNESLKNGEISPEEHDWIKTYLENPNDVKTLKEKGVNILLKDGYPVDHAQQKVLMNLMKKEHYDDFHTGMMDQISSGASGDFKASLSDYSAASTIDFMTGENSKFLDGLNGYVEFMDKRLAEEPANMKRFKEARKKADLTHIDEGHPVSQKGLFQELKNVDHDIQRVPHGVPKNVRYRAKQERDIAKLKRDISRLKKLAKRDPSAEGKIDEAANKLRDIKSSREKLLSPNKELDALENHFLGKKLLPENYKNTHDYHRLVDLSHVSTKADALLHHIDLKDNYETQLAYKDMIKFLNEVIGSNVNKFSDPNKVVNYFKSRLDSVGTDVEEMSNMKDVRNKREVPIESGRGAYSDVEKRDELSDMQRDMKRDVRNDEEILKANETDVDSARSKEFEDMYKAAKERYTQFKDNEEALSQLVSCELGSRGVSE